MRLALTTPFVRLAGRSLLVSIVLLAAALIGEQRAAATLCTSDATVAERLAAGEVAFVGEAVATRNIDRFAIFHVSDVWSDDRIPEFVEVRGTDSAESWPDIFSNVTSADRSYHLGVVYLVFPTWRDHAWHDGTCSATQPFNDDLAGLRPDSAHPPVPGGDAGVQQADWQIVAILAVAVLVLVGFVIVARARGRGQTTGSA